MTETCKWLKYDENESECGEPAPYKVKVRGKITHATVPLCSEHKATHDQQFAKIRAASRGQGPPV